MKIILFFLCVLISRLLADTIYVANYGDGSPSLSNVLSAYNASSKGDTIMFPLNGSATWSSYLTISKPLTIDGNGTTLTGSGTMTHGFFYLSNFKSSSLMRITNFIFDLNSTSGGSALFFYGLSLSSFRFDHNTVYHGGTVMEIRGVKGVIDNNYFYNSSRTILYSAGTRNQADSSWLSMKAGTGNALFIEDNYFIIDGNWTGGTTNDECFDSYNGGKVVIRYNTFDSTDLPSSMTQFWTIQFHGSAAGGCAHGYWQQGNDCRRGQSVVEVYHNTMIGKKISRLVTLRGATNLVYSNTVQSTYSVIVYMYEEEYYETQWSPLRTEWPAEDQVHNTFFWDNTFNDDPQDSAHTLVDSQDYIKLNRDYFLHAPCKTTDETDTCGNPATYGKETFTGANGASSSYPTDGNYYPTEGTMVFTADVDNAYVDYVPYIYPHPLRYTHYQISPPKNLKVSK